MVVVGEAKEREVVKGVRLFYIYLLVKKIKKVAAGTLDVCERTTKTLRTQKEADFKKLKITD